MNKNLLSCFGFTIAISLIASCQSSSTEQKTDVNTTKDTMAGQNTKSVEFGYADVNGLKLYYEVHGQGKPLVLLHGSYMTIPLNWSQAIPILSKDRKVIVAEMQGHGRTRDIAREFSYENMADDVSGLLGHLKIDSADILGYSMGGGVAFRVAIQHPEQVRRLVIVSAPYAHNGWWPEVEKSFATFTPDIFDGTPIRKQYDSLGNDPAQFPAFVKKVVSVDLKPYDWSKDAKKIKAPIFMLIGDADGVRYEHALELFRVKGGGKMGDITGPPQSRLAILPGTTHVGMMMQRANWWISMVTDFLDADLNAKPATF